MREAFAVAVLNFKQGLREKLFWGVVFFLVFFLAFSLLLGKLSPGETERVLRNAGLSGIELSGIILVVFSLIFSFYREKDSRILEIYLSHFSRTHYIAGKLLGYLLICFFYLILAGLGYALILFLAKAFLWQVLIGLYSLFLKLAILVSLSLIFACLLSSPVLALLCSLSLYLAGEIAYPVLKIVSLGQDKANLALFKFLYYLLPNMHELDLKSQATHGEPPSFNFLFFISLYSFTYILFLWVIARHIFIRKEY